MDELLPQNAVATGGMGAFYWSRARFNLKKKKAAEAAILL
jgi:hypothetical protein